MELPGKLLEQIAFNKGSETEEHLLIVLDKSIHEDHLSQLLQAKKKHFKIAVTILTGFNGIFNVRNSNNKFYSAKSTTDQDGFIQITMPPGAYEIESLKKEFKRIFVDEEHFTEANYPFNIHLKFSTLGSSIEIFTEGPFVSFLRNDSIGDLLRFNATTLYKD